MGHDIKLCENKIINLEDEIPIFTILDGEDEIKSFIYRWRNANEVEAVSYLTHETLHWILWKICGKCTSNERFVTLLEQLSTINWDSHHEESSPYS